jgi:hypothetical protein
LFEVRTIGRWARSGHRRIRFETEERFFKVGSDLAPFAEICREPESIAKACGLASRMREEDVGGRPALYVFGVGDLPVAKIGVSHCPISRLEQIQREHWADISVYAIAWCGNGKSETIEQTALAAADEMGVKLRGEWVAMEPAEAFELILKSARYTGHPICDSATWLDNLAIRTRGLAQALAHRRARKAA